MIRIASCTYQDELSDEVAASKHSGFNNRKVVQYLDVLHN